jgi:hypothetical protein
MIALTEGTVSLNPGSVVHEFGNFGHEVEDLVFAALGASVEVLWGV